MAEEGLTSECATFSWGFLSKGKDVGERHDKMKQNNPGGVWWGCKTGKRGQNHPFSPFLAVPLTLPLLVIFRANFVLQKFGSSNFATFRRAIQSHFDLVTPTREPFSPRPDFEPLFDLILT